MAEKSQSGNYLMWVLEPSMMSALDVSPDVPVLVSSMDLTARRWLLGISEMFIDGNIRLTGVRLDVRNWESIAFTFHKAADAKAEPLIQSMDWAGEIGVLAGFSYDGTDLKAHGYLRDSEYYYCEVTFRNPELYVEYFDRREFTPHALP
ncbi:hypothetical protein E7T09_01385 [Deinococcus sp. KSM4-11]|uniref:hypothetical protein n=1 Tax=Deinococcus sp. KSM4-11 TaxID=2568654 RepID=UPI0010A2C31C|nr:hypothetical protein [Deinococcus sp. KSM4-11]THF87912.1 hypothetical protein E7T09_01385 [Deinococcus sp. KSM4-11]